LAGIRVVYGLRLLHVLRMTKYLFFRRVRLNLRGRKWD
jgi:hypothetical protein